MMGYGYIAFDEHHFNEDLQYTDAIPMFRRLLALAGDLGCSAGPTLVGYVSSMASGDFRKDEPVQIDPVP